MKVSAAQRRLLAAINCIIGGEMSAAWLRPAERAMAKRMRIAGLLSKRAFAKGSLRMTGLGRKALSSTRDTGAA